MEIFSKNTEMVKIHLSRGFFHPRDWTWFASRFFTIWATVEALAFTWPQEGSCPHTRLEVQPMTFISLCKGSYSCKLAPPPKPVMLLWIPIILAQPIFIKRIFIWILLQILTLEPPWKLCYWEEVETLKKTLFFCVLCMLRTFLLCWFTWLLT